MYCLTSYASPIGLLTLGSDGKHLTGLWIQGQKYFGGAIREELVQRDSLRYSGMPGNGWTGIFPDRSHVRMSFPWRRRERNSRS